MTWEPEIEELRRRGELARRMGGDERIARAREAGRLTVRERIDLLLDKGSFEEIGALAGFVRYLGDELTDFTPSNILAGTGRIDGRRVVVCGDDFTVRGGAADAAIHRKQMDESLIDAIPRRTRSRFRGFRARARRRWGHRSRTNRPGP